MDRTDMDRTGMDSDELLANDELDMETPDPSTGNEPSSAYLGEDSFGEQIGTPADTDSDTTGTDANALTGSELDDDVEGRVYEE